MHSKIAVGTIVVIVSIVGILLFGSWILTRGVPDESSGSVPVNQPQAAEPSEDIPSEPSNPNVTGGTSGVGNGSANDPAVGQPSPAGGVDTNSVPSTGNPNGQ